MKAENATSAPVTRVEMSSRVTKLWSLPSVELSPVYPLAERPVGRAVSSTYPGEPGPPESVI